MWTQQFSVPDEDVFEIFINIRIRFAGRKKECPEITFQCSSKQHNSRLLPQNITRLVQKSEKRGELSSPPPYALIVSDYLVTLSHMLRLHSSEWEINSEF